MEIQASIGYQAFWYCTGLTNVTIPDSVTSIGNGAFSWCSGLTAITVGATNSVYSSMDGVLFNKKQTMLIQFPGGKAGSYTIPNSVTNIGVEAFSQCTSLTSVTIPNSVTKIGDHEFIGCTGLTSITIPNSVTSLGSGAFMYCSSLAGVTIGNNVTNIGDNSFFICTSLTGVYFQGNTPSVGSFELDGANNATVYYLAGTTGWDTTFAGRPTKLWKPQVQTKDGNFGVKADIFGFTVTYASGQAIVVEACTDLVNPTWSPLQTKTLSGDAFYFSDPDWMNHPVRFYRLRSP